MTHPIRFQQREAVYLVTNRCILNSAFFRPSEDVNRIIEETLVWAASKHAVILYGYNFRLSDFWMAMGAPKLNRQDFMRDFQSRLAIKLNRHWGRSGRFFAGRYKCIHLLDNETAWRSLCRVICAPCEVDLVDHPRKWSGVSSYELNRNGSTLEVERENRTKFWRLKQKHPHLSDEEATKLATETHRLELGKLRFSDFSRHEDYNSALIAMVEGEAKRLSRGRTRRCLGMERVLRLSPCQASGYPIPNTLPNCAASTITSRRDFRRRRLRRRDRYQSARDGLRIGRRNVAFPAGTIPLHKSVTVAADDTPTSSSSLFSASIEAHDDWEKCG